MSSLDRIQLRRIFNSGWNAISNPSNVYTDFLHRPPIFFFGPVDTAQIVTIGLNPSRHEFVDDGGSIPMIFDRDVQFEVQTNYFHVANTYKKWWMIAQRFLSPSGVAYPTDTLGYTDDRPMLTAHVDLIPFASSKGLDTLVNGLHKSKATNHDKVVLGLQQIFDQAVLPLLGRVRSAAFVIFGTGKKGGNYTVNKILKRRSQRVVHWNSIEQTDSGSGPKVSIGQATFGDNTIPAFALSSGPSYYLRGSVHTNDIDDSAELLASHLKKIIATTE